MRQILAFYVGKQNKASGEALIKKLMKITSSIILPIHHLLLAQNLPTF